MSIVGINNDSTADKALVLDAANPGLMTGTHKVPRPPKV